jgi:hypothetical protein
MEMYPGELDILDAVVDCRINGFLVCTLCDITEYGFREVWMEQIKARSVYWGNPLNPLKSEGTSVPDQYLTQ